MQLYLDLIWLLNLLFDWTILLLVAWLTKSVFSRKRVFFGALFASLIIPLSIGLGLEWLFHPLAKLIYSIGIVWIAFSYRHLKTLVTQWFCFYIVNFTIGGGIYGLYTFLDGTIPINNLTQGYGNVYSWITVSALFPIVLYLTKEQFQRLTIHRMNEQQLYPVFLTYNNTQIKANGFYDSGNQLTHPISKKPVILLDESTSQRLFGESMTNKMIQSASLSTSEQSQLSIQLIPYKAAGGGENYLKAILLDRVSIEYNSITYTTKNVYAGVQPGRFSNSIDFQVLLHSLVFQSKRTKIFQSEGAS
ncbi:sigma-E processing peptidase SpoIIGA [Allobacillus sp. GCM10007491]|uniref:Sporulation sigma-E factor-processing peptidase n=1 Tax=Allobacillus saliphilus TaxID=2912308 RepID=A0A941HRW7_9BACI|nr:sigma-E processing peptidase SpoIIGA [Allobacillus saliphilus]MBR7552803.1 sigma-E processing peptidase SpoIIGA [Allobacillus saliphilus]